MKIEWTRRRFLRDSAAAAAVALLGPLAACGKRSMSPTLARARRQGFIRVGFADEAPFGFIDGSGRLTGEAPEVAREVMRRLGVDSIDGVLTPFGSLIPGLLDGRFDLITAGMFITPERCQKIVFSDPDYCIEQAFLVPQGNPSRIHRYEDIASNADVRLGVTTGAVEVLQAEEAGVDPARVHRFDTAPDLLVALKANRIDAAALTTVSAAALAGLADFTGVEVTESFAFKGQPGCGGFGFRQADADFRDEFNSVLVNLKRNGGLSAIAGRFGFDDAIDAAADLTAADLCDSTND